MLNSFLYSAVFGRQWFSPFYLPLYYPAIVQKKLRNRKNLLIWTENYQKLTSNPGNHPYSQAGNWLSRLPITVR